VDERVPCFSEEVEHDILSSSFDRFQDAVAPFDCTESVSGSSSCSQSSFSQHFSPRAACYSYRDVHDFVTKTGKPNYLVARVPVPSTLNISKWHELLQGYDDNVVCDFLEFGWPVGFMPTTLPVFDLWTHHGAILFSEQVTAYLTKEMSLRRVAGPFDTMPFTDGFVVSPLNTVPKWDSDERRVIVDLSWSCGNSVNDGIPSDSFVGEPISLTYPTIDSIVDAVISLGPGCLLYKRDLKKAYRQFPVDPKDYHLLGTPGTISSILIRSLPWAYGLRLWPVSNQPQLFPGFLDNRGAHCSIIWMILLESLLLVQPLVIFKR